MRCNRHAYCYLNFSRTNYVESRIKFLGDQEIIGCLQKKKIKKKEKSQGGAEKWRNAREKTKKFKSGENNKFIYFGKQIKLYEGKLN